MKSKVSKEGLEGPIRQGKMPTYSQPKLVEYGSLSEITLQVSIAGKGDNTNKTNSKTV